MSFSKQTISNRSPIGNQLMTAEELIKLPRGRFRYELIKGELLTMSPAGEQHGVVIMKVAAPLAHHVATNKLGIVYGADTGFKLESDPDTVLAPDIAFISRARIGKLSIAFRDGAPDLAVEVTSPGESRKKVAKKARQWLTLGALVVWVVDPQKQIVTIFRSAQDAKILTTADELTGADVVLGFKIPVSEIFDLDNY